LAHVVLGLSLSGAPLGAWLAITNDLALPAWLLAGGVLCWTTGFDILYALQDLEFDQEQGLHSVPARLGVHQSLWLSRFLHITALVLWGLFNIHMGARLFPWLAWLAVAGILAREQWLVKGGNLEQINQAFFTMNSLVGLVLFSGHFIEWTLVKLIRIA
jgi:4-hydroxybenzoate polyprenyltransferase